MSKCIFKFEMTSEDELKNYRDGILAILNKVELNECDEFLMKNLKSVYQLLNHLNQDQFLNPKSDRS